MQAYPLVSALIHAHSCRTLSTSTTGRSALLIESTWRMAVCRRAFLRTRGAAVVVQAHWRGTAARRRYAEMVRRHRAAVRIQAAARGAAQQARYRAALQSVLAIQVWRARWHRCCWVGALWRRCQCIHLAAG